MEQKIQINQSEDKIAIIIPCHNEEEGIGKVLDKIPYQLLQRLGFKTKVIVIDNNSSDNTAEIARERNVTVIHESKKGKGNAIKTGFRHIDPDTKYVVMLDGDNTYNSLEIPRMIEPLASDFCDVIIGSRLGGKIQKNSLHFSNRMANWFYTFLVRNFYRANTTDVLSGYFAWKKKVIDDLLPHLTSEGFAIEMEMTAKIVKLGYQIYSVPITYNNREGQSKLNRLQDGKLILGSFIKNLLWFPQQEY